MVSSLHASIEAADGRWILEDLGSTNGTFVNGREIVGRVSLAHGDEIVLGCDESDGSVGFVVEMTESNLAAPSARAADARATDTKTATPPREPPKELPRAARPEVARAPIAPTVRRFDPTNRSRSAARSSIPAKPRRCAVS
jgi:pSer/pThr/pTyr-binding forkhead associated (FHA) protein